MRRKLRRMGDGWAIPLTADELTALGLDTVGQDEPLAVLVSVKAGKQLVVRRVPTFDEAMRDSLNYHQEALAILGAMPNDAGEAQTITADSDV